MIAGSERYPSGKAASGQKAQGSLDAFNLCELLASCPHPGASTAPAKGLLPSSPPPAEDDRLGGKRSSPEVAQIGEHWFVCHLGRKVSVPFLARDKAESCRRALDEVSHQLLIAPLTLPGGRKKLKQHIARADLRERRKRLGMTAVRLAKEVGLNKSTISLAELRGIGSASTISLIETALSAAEKSRARVA